jgi:hypothetical protein
MISEFSFPAMDMTPLPSLFQPRHRYVVTMMPWTAQTMGRAAPTIGPQTLAWQCGGGERFRCAAELATQPLWGDGIDPAGTLQAAATRRLRSVEQPVNRKLFLRPGRRHRPTIGTDRRGLGGDRGLRDRGAGWRIKRPLAPAVRKCERQPSNQYERQSANGPDHEAPSQCGASLADSLHPRRT